MKTAKDFFGNDISVGDIVAFMQTGYRVFLTGTVISVTEKTVLIAHEKTNVGTTETRQFHGQVFVKK